MKPLLPLLAWILLLPAALLAAPPPAPAESPSGTPAEIQSSPLRVYAHTLEHRSAGDASLLVRHRLSPRGTVEVQPGTNTLVVRDIDSVIRRVRGIVGEFDVPPTPLRLDVQVIRAGSSPAVISPPTTRPPVDPSLTERLRKLLRYESYEVMARAELSAQEGEEVDYALGERFAVSFRLGDLMGGRRMQMRDFRVVERATASTDKGRRPRARDLFDAHLNLWLDRPFTLVLTENEEKGEALLVVVTIASDEAEPEAGN